MTSFFLTRVNERPFDVFSRNMVLGPDEYEYPVNKLAYKIDTKSIALNLTAEAAVELGNTGEIYASFTQKAEGFGAGTQIVRNR